MKKIINMTEKIMNLWAKITSLVIVGGLIYWIYITIQIFLLPIQTPIWIYSMPFLWILGLIFYSPFFYYGWVKKPDNHMMKTFTKFMTIIYIVAVVFGSIFSISKLSDILFILIALVLIAPLYYYAWKK